MHFYYTLCLCNITIMTADVIPNHWWCRLFPSTLRANVHKYWLCLYYSRVPTRESVSRDGIIDIGVLKAYGFHMLWPNGVIIEFWSHSVLGCVRYLMALPVYFSCCLPDVLVVPLTFCCPSKDIFVVVRLVLPIAFVLSSPAAAWHESDSHAFSRMPTFERSFFDVVRPILEM